MNDGSGTRQTTRSDRTLGPDRLLVLLDEPEPLGMGDPPRWSAAAQDALPAVASGDGLGEDGNQFVLIHAIGRRNPSIGILGQEPSAIGRGPSR